MASAIEQLAAELGALRDRVAKLEEVSAWFSLEELREEIRKYSRTQRDVERARAAQAEPPRRAGDES